MNPTAEYVCAGCGKRGAPRGWIALRISGDRRGLEIRLFDDSGPDDMQFCGEPCAFKRVSELIGARRERAAAAEKLREGRD